MVGPTGVAVAVPPGLDGVGWVNVTLPAGAEVPPVGTVKVEIKVVGAVPEGAATDVLDEQGTVIVVPSVTIVVYDVADAVTLLETLVDETVVTVAVGVQFGKVNVPL